MLLAAISVLVVVASGDPADGSTQAMEQALRGALGRDVQVAVRSSAEGASDESLVATANSEHAALLVVVAWSERQRRATLRIVKPRRRDAGPIARSASTPPTSATERGRTVGFALASMVPDDAARSSDRPPDAAPARAGAARSADAGRRRGDEARRRRRAPRSFPLPTRSRSRPRRSP